MPGAARPACRPPRMRWYCMPEPATNQGGNRFARCLLRTDRSGPRSPANWRNGDAGTRAGRGPGAGSRFGRQSLRREEPQGRTGPAHGLPRDRAPQRRRRRDRQARRGRRWGPSGRAGLDLERPIRARLRHRGRIRRPARGPGRAPARRDGLRRRRLSGHSALDGLPGRHPRGPGSGPDPSYRGGRRGGRPLRNPNRQAPGRHRRDHSELAGESGTCQGGERRPRPRLQARGRGRAVCARSPAAAASSSRDSKAFTEPRSGTGTGRIFRHAVAKRRVRGQYPRNSAHGARPGAID